jgi:hypothetical protein
MQPRLLIYVIVVLSMSPSPGHPSEPPTREPDEKQLRSGQPVIYKLIPEQQTGRGFKLIYMVDAPIDVFWRFKTDFDSQFVLSNKFIKSHRLLSRQGNVFITEVVFKDDMYTHKPGAKFRWQTTVLSDIYRLDFVLLNPEECGQKFHYGHIQLAAVGQKTKVTQVAYFDFFGVIFWVNYPWYGGMSAFLKYTAHWEQETILKLKGHYIQSFDN